MQLSRFKIQNYKVIDETEWIPVDEKVTALVGRNESGKTAILKSLWKSLNVAGETFDKLLDYPRGRYARERKGNQQATALEFALTPEEAAELAERFPFDLDEPLTTVICETSYLGEEKTSSSITFPAGIEFRCKKGIGEAKAAIDAVADELQQHAGQGDETISEAKAAVLQVLDPKQVVWSKSNREAITAFKTAIDRWIAGAAERAPLAALQRTDLDRIFTEVQAGDPAAPAREWVKENLPVFIYFDDYGQLKTRIHLPTYLRLVKEPHVQPEVRTQRALFRWSGLDPEEILHLGTTKQGESQEDIQRRLDKRRTLLQSASFSLTGDWTEWWTPEARHKLHISADGDQLVLNVSDTRTEFEIPFEERSHGFQWFFSFYLVFLVESQQAHRGAILLLDEPGLHLHPTLQSKLIGFFEAVADKNQLLYSTHLPFLVDGDHLERVRTVYLNDEDPPKTIVSPDIRAGGDRDTLFPLQAAVGYSIAQTLFLGRRSVIVEGITDYWIMKALDSCLSSLDRGPVLDNEVVLIPAGGTRRLMPLASIMFSTSGVEGRRMLVVLDSDAEGTQAGQRLERELFGDASRVLVLSDIIGQESATIEDLVTRSAYVDAVSWSSGRSISLNDAEKKAPTNVAAMSMHFERKGWGKFGVEEKAAAAIKLVEYWGKDPSKVPEATLKRAAVLFNSINAKFEG